MLPTDLPILTFVSSDALRAWLMEHHATSSGIWVRLYKKQSGVESVTFEEVLDEGLCFGWSESKRIKGDEKSYLQRFTPRRSQGTHSPRNLSHAKQLIQAGKMTPAGLTALGLKDEAN